MGDPRESSAPDREATQHMLAAWASQQLADTDLAEVGAWHDRRRREIVAAMFDTWVLLSDQDLPDAPALERDGCVFSVAAPDGTRGWPAWQFVEPGSSPRPIVAEVLAALPREHMSAEGVGLWWFANNAWLPDEARPYELVGTPDEQRIVDAARRLAEPEPL